MALLIMYVAIIGKESMVFLIVENQIILFIMEERNESYFLQSQFNNEKI